MSDRFLERRTAQGLVAGLAPPFNRQVVEARLGEMMRDGLGFGRCVFAQTFGCPGMQPLAATLEQTLVGCILDQRMLEAIAGLRWRAFDKQAVGLDKPIQRRLQRQLVERRNVAKQRISKLASKNRANLCDLARGPQSIEARGKRLLQGWWDGL